VGYNGDEMRSQGGDNEVVVFCVTIPRSFVDFTNNTKNPATSGLNNTTYFSIPTHRQHVPINKPTPETTY